jgi:hypothetical protein
MPNRKETYATLPAAAWFRHRVLSFFLPTRCILLLAVLQELLLLSTAAAHQTNAAAEVLVGW